MNSFLQPNSSAGLSVVIPTYGRAKYLRELLTSLASCDLAGIPCEIIVVDNIGTPEIKQLCLKHKDSLPSLIYLLEPKAGVSNARNAGVMASKFEYIVLLDDDVVFEKSWLKILWDQIGTCSDSIFCPRILCAVDPNWKRWLKARIESGVGQYDLGDESKSLSPQQAKLPIGAAVAFPKQYFDQFGPFDIRLDRIRKQLMGGGETKFFRLAFQSGIGVRYVANSVVHHNLTDEKHSRWFWIRQGYHGGRSFVRIQRNLRKDRLVTVVESTYKIAANLVMTCIKPGNAFRHLYSCAAYLGRIKESLFGWQDFGQLNTDNPPSEVNSQPEKNTPDPTCQTPTGFLKSLN